jgi:hypothetical protein
MTELTAIDILVDPDEAAIERARRVNARLLESMPGWPWTPLTFRTSRHCSATCAPRTLTMFMIPSRRRW